MSNHRAIFFDKQVHMDAWKHSMSGKNESRCLSLLLMLGYKLDEDFVRQHPIFETRVVDFAFVNEMIVIEIDGKSHDAKSQKVHDRKTDEFLRKHGWAILRIKEEALFGERGSFWKNLIRDVIEDRRKEFLDGKIFSIEPARSYYSEDYNLT